MSFPWLNISIWRRRKKASSTANTSYMWYGVTIDESNSSSDLTRIAGSGYMSAHATLPVQSQIKGCLLADDGTVNYYLDSADWSKKVTGEASNLDGTDGQVMVEIPEFYYKVEMNATGAGVHNLKISHLPLNGFTKVSKRYIGAYEVALNRTTSKLASVKNTSTDYRGGNNNADYDAGVNSLLGCPVTVVSRANFRTYARNRGTGWNIIGYDDHKWIYWLYVIEYATLNSQKAFNADLTVEGYHQGGLGTGVTTAVSAEWSAFNSSNPFILCGTSDTLANASGIVDCVKTDFGGTGVNRTFSVPRYRGLENLFGHMMSITDGAIVVLQSDADGGENRVYVTEDVSLWNDSDYSLYRYVGVVARLKALAKIAILGDNADFLAKVAEGVDYSTYYCDYHYTETPASTLVQALMLSGRSADNTLAGLTYVNLNRAATYTSNSYGSRLRYQ